MILKPNLTRAEFVAIFGYDCPYLTMSKEAMAKRIADSRNAYKATLETAKILREIKKQKEVLR